MDTGCLGWNVLDELENAESEHDGKTMKVLYILSFFQSSVVDKINANVLSFVVSDAEELDYSIKVLEDLLVVRYSDPCKKYIYPLDEEFRLIVQIRLQTRVRDKIFRKQCLKALVELFEITQIFEFESFVSVLQFAGEYQVLMEDLCELPNKVIFNLLNNNRRVENDKCLENLNEIYAYHCELLRDNERLKSILQEHACGLEVEGHSRDEMCATALSMFLDLAILYQPDYFLTPSAIEAVMEASNKMFDLSYFKEAVDGYRFVFEDQTISTASDKEILKGWHCYAKALSELNCIAESLDILQGLSKRLKAIDANHIDIPAVNRSIAKAWLKQNNMVEAWKYLEEARISFKNLGELHEETLITEREMAFLLQQQDLLDDALKVLKKVAPEFQEVFGKSHEETLMAYSNLASIYFLKSQCNEAFGIYAYVLKEQNLSLGKFDAETLKTKHNLASTLLQCGRVGEALNLFDELLEIYYELNHNDCIELLESIRYTRDTFGGIKRNLFRQTLHTAIVKGVELQDVVSMVERDGIDVNLRDPDGRTPLHCAAETGRVDLVVYLLQKGAQYNAECKFGRRPEDGTESPEVKQVLSALEDAFANTGEIIPRVVNARDEEGNTLLHRTSDAGHAEAVSALLAAGAEATVANSAGETPLHLAVSRDRRDAARLLLQSGGDTKRLLEARSDVQGRTALHMAARSGSPQMLKLLLVHGAYFAARDAAGATPAALSTSAECSDLLEVVADMFRSNHPCNTLGVVVGRSVVVDEGKAFFVSKIHTRKEKIEGV